MAATTTSDRERLDNYLDAIEAERDRRPAEALLADEIKRLREALDGVAPVDGRYVVLNDDADLMATDDPMDGDNILVDRGEGW